MGKTISNHIHPSLWHAAVGRSSGGFFYARAANQIEFAKVPRNRGQRTFTVNFRCQPFWYAEVVLPITLTASGSTITNPGNVASEPSITVYGSGEITLMEATPVPYP